MKTKVVFLAMIIVALCQPIVAAWRVDATEYARTHNLAGQNTLGPCIFATQNDCLNHIQEIIRQVDASFYEPGQFKCVECSGSGAGFQGTPEQQLAQGLVGGLLDSIFKPKRDNARQAEIEKQNTIQRQQAVEQERQRLQAEEQEKQRQIKLQKEEELARQKKFDEEKGQLMDSFKDDRTGSVVTSEMKLKPMGTDFFQSDAVDLRGKQGVVGSLTTSEQQKKRDEWYQGRGFNEFSRIPENGIDGSKPPERSWGEASLRTALGQISGLEGSIASFGLNVGDATVKNLNQAVGTLVRGDDAGAEKLGNELLNGKVAKEAGTATLADTAAGFITDKSLAYGQKIVKLGFEKKEVARVVEQGEMGIAPLKEILKSAKQGVKISDNIYKGSKLLIDLWDNKKGGK